VHVIFSHYIGYMNKKLSYRKQIARNVEGINRKPVTFGLGFTEGHWKRHNSIHHIRLTVSRVMWRWILSWRWSLVRGHSRSFKLVPFESWVTVSYSHFIINMAVPLAVCETHSVKECSDLQNCVKGRSRSLKMAPFDRPYDFLLVGHCQYSSILHQFLSYLALNNIVIPKS